MPLASDLKIGLFLKMLELWHNADFKCDIMAAMCKEFTFNLVKDT